MQRDNTMNGWACTGGGSAAHTLMCGGMREGLAGVESVQGMSTERET